MNKELYLKIKEKYVNFVCMVKCGSFYRSYGEDAYILWKFFKYKVVDDKVGFPSSVVDNVLKILKGNFINAVVVDGEEFNEYKFVNNKYNVYCELAKEEYDYEEMKEMLKQLIEEKLNDDVSNYEKIFSFLNNL